MHTTPRSLRASASLLAALLVTTSGVQAADILKASSGTGLTTGASWVNNVAPTSADTAVFDITANTGSTLDVPSGNPTWGSIRITDTSSSVNISTATGTWTIGGNSGATTVIDLSSAANGTNNLSIDGSVATRDLRLSSTAGSYTFNIASGRTFTLGANMRLFQQSGTRTWTFQGGGTTLINGLVGVGAVNTTYNLTNHTLGGTGTVSPRGSGSLIVGNGSFLAPGNGGAGTLTIDASSATGVAVTMQAGSGLKFDLGAGGTFVAPGTSDRLSVTTASAGDVVFNNNVIDLGNTGSAGVFKLFDTSLDASTWTGLSISGQAITGGLSFSNLAEGFTGALILGDGASFGDAGDIYLQVTAGNIPEPSAFAALAGLGALGLAALRRRRA